MMTFKCLRWLPIRKSLIQNANNNTWQAPEFVIFWRKYN
jgi:hypothetical protein